MFIRSSEEQPGLLVARPDPRCETRNDRWLFFGELFISGLAFTGDDDYDGSGKYGSLKNPHYHIVETLTHIGIRRRSFGGKLPVRRKSRLFNPLHETA
jgi:hypothetical protein